MSRSKQRTHCQHSCVTCKSWKKGWDDGDEALTAQDRRSKERDQEQLRSFDRDPGDEDDSA